MGICPEVEKEACAVLEGTAEVAMLPQIDLRIEDSREDPGVLEEVVPRRRLGGARPGVLLRTATGRGIPNR